MLELICLPELLDKLISKISFVSTYQQLVNMKQFWKDGIISVKIRSLEINLPKILCISMGEGNGTPLQYSCLENSMDREAWWDAVHGVANSRTQLSDLTFTVHFHALEKEMATHSSVLAWGIPGAGEPGGLQFMGSLRVRHNQETSLSLFTFMRWRRKWQPTPVGSLVGCRLWGCTESNTTEAT